jgi:hypothetical protein
MDTEYEKISALDKTTTVTVVDTTDPVINFEGPTYTNEKCLVSLPFIGCILESTDANVVVNVSDHGNIVELKYLWLPFDEEPKKHWWIIANSFENGKKFTRTLLNDGILDWNLWIYAKDDSGNWIVSSVRIRKD